MMRTPPHLSINNTIKILIFLSMICSASGPLPKFARRVNSCPEANNLTAWKEAAERLNCSEYTLSIQSIEDIEFYNCLPSGFLNETVEFCGRIAAIAARHCPILIYEHGATVVTSRSCERFTRGCPDPKYPPYHNWFFYKYYECWHINKKKQCYYAEPECPQEEKISDKIETSISFDETLNNTSTTPRSTTVQPEIPSFVWIIIATLIGLLVIFVGVLVGILFFYDIHISKKGCKKDEEFELTGDVPGHFITQDLEKNSSEKKGLLDNVSERSDHQREIPLHIDVNHQTPEKRWNENNPATSDKVNIHPASQMTSEEFKEYLKETFKLMKADTVEFLKKRLTEFGHDKTSLRGMDTPTVLEKMSDIIKLEFNMSFLEWIFAIKEEYVFAETCKKFSPWDRFDHVFKRMIPGTRNRYLQFQMREDKISEEYPKVIDNLRVWLGKAINDHRGNILMTALEKDPLVVTYMMNEIHAEQILKFLMTDDGQIEAYHKNVQNIMELKDIISIEKPLNGKNFIHVTVSCQYPQTKTLELGLKKMTKAVIQTSGLKMSDVKEVYVRARSLDKQEKGSKGDSDYARTFFDKKKKYLLDNLEPSILMKEKHISSLFDNDAVEKMRQIGSRREKAEGFLNLCNNLSEDDLNTVVSYLKAHYIESSTNACNSQIDQFKSSIEKNRDTVLEDIIDSEVIETTLSKIGSIPSDVQRRWNGSKPRKERYENFLNFVFESHDNIQAFQETMAEKGIELDQN